jgi:hypothetical protein
VRSNLLGPRASGPLLRAGGPRSQARQSHRSEKLRVSPSSPAFVSRGVGGGGVRATESHRVRDAAGVISPEGGFGEPHPLQRERLEPLKAHVNSCGRRSCLSFNFALLSASAGSLGQLAWARCAGPNRLTSFRFLLMNLRPLQIYSSSHLKGSESYRLS